MTLTKKILIGLAVVAGSIFKVATKKIGPCSPQLDDESYSKYHPKQRKPTGNSKD